MKRYKSKFTEDYKLERFLNAISISKKINSIHDITVEATPKGNWYVYYKGKVLTTVDSSLLDDETIIKYNLEH